MSLHYLKHQRNETKETNMTEKIVKYVEENSEALHVDEDKLREFTAKYNRSDVYTALASIDWGVEFTKWSSESLADLVENGPVYPHDRTLYTVLYSCALREISSRNTEGE